MALPSESEAGKSLEKVAVVKTDSTESSQTATIQDLIKIFKSNAPDIPLDILIQSNDPKVLLKSSDEKDSYWSEGQKTIQTFADDSNFKIAIGSGYPIILKDDKKVRHRDPIVDMMFIEKFGNVDESSVFIFSGADGSGASADVFKVALAACEAFMESVIDQLKKNKIANAKDLVEIGLSAIAAGQEKVMDTHPIARTTHLGMIVSKNRAGKILGMATSVGDMALFLLKKDGSTIEITKGNRGSSTSVNDPGGQLGGVFGTASGERFADYRNLSVYFFEAEEGDILLPMSDGIHDNLDPVNNGHLTPQSAVDEMIKNNVKDANLLNVPPDFKTEGPDLESLKSLYKAYKLGQIAQSKERENIAEALVQHCYDLSRELRNMAGKEVTVQGKPKMPGDIDKEAYDADRQTYKGKLDHMGCAQIPL